MAKVIISEKVLEKIQHYADNLSAFTENPITGKNFALLCLDEIDNLSTFPERHRYFANSTKFRELIVKNHIILYQYENKSDIVYVANMKHGSELGYR